MILKIYRVNRNNPLPRYMTDGASGVDLFASLENPESIAPNEFKHIPTGIIISLPNGYEAQIRPRSGLAFESGVTVLNSPGTIDADYRGEIGVILINHGKKPFRVTNGMRIAQMVISSCVSTQIQEVLHIEELSPTKRDSGGFGHTGVQ
jgi:dUTP pyrophosphatase